MNRKLIAPESFYMSGGANLLPKLMPISFSGVHLIFEVFQDTWRSNKGNPSAYWNAALSCPFIWPQTMQICISFRSRSDLVLDAHHVLDFLSYLVLQACVSFCSVSDKSGASLFLPCPHKHAVAHICNVFEGRGTPPGPEYEMRTGILANHLPRMGETWLSLEQVLAHSCLSKPL